MRAWDASPTGVAVALEASTQQRSFLFLRSRQLSDAREAVASRRLLEVLDRPEVRTELEEEFGDFSVDFEVQGWDVVIMYAGSVALELKPAVGDDYPAILRTMKLRRAEKGWWRALIVDRFEANGAARRRQMGIRTERHRSADAGRDPRRHAHLSVERTGAT